MLLIHENQSIYTFMYKHLFIILVKFLLLLILVYKLPVDQNVTNKN